MRGAPVSTQILLPNPTLVFLNDNGAPASGWWISTYGAGGLTPQNAFTDATGSTPLANPVQLDTRGQIPGGGGFFGTPGLAYKIVLARDNGLPPSNVVWSRDQVIGIATANINFAAISDALTGTSTTLVMNPLDVA